VSFFDIRVHGPWRRFAGRGHGPVDTAGRWTRVVCAELKCHNNCRCCWRLTSSRRRSCCCRL